MEHILVSNIISEKINAASGREVFILSMDIINHWTKEFKLIIILRDKVTAKDEKVVFTPKFNDTLTVSFSSAIVKVGPDKDLHFQLECVQPILGKLSYRFF
jgi:hypothetical protein